MNTTQTSENKNEGKDVVLVDAYNIIYRAYHGNLSGLTNKEGIPTSALFTTIKMLNKLPSQFSQLEFCLAVFDGGKNFRKELDDSYKTNRKEMPADLQLQMPLIKKAMDLLGWPIHQSVDEEADDAIATLATRAADKGYNVYIISGDKDFRQIVSDKISIIDTMNDICYDRNKVIEKMGIPPEQVRDYLALCGDSADNVPGVAKAGPKTVVKWLTQYGSIDTLIEKQHEITGKVGDNLRSCIASGELALWRTLVTVKTDVALNLRRSQLTLKEPQHAELRKFYEEMNFTSLLRQMPAP